MAAAWETSWTEIWSTGEGRDRSYCGIAKTLDGYAVDVFERDTCVVSVIFPNREEAVLAAGRMRARYGRPAPRRSTPLTSGDSVRAH